ncbi:amidase family protein [Phenylobacterium sp.]|uniref:amidase family protein n=1 Tax=Phenylobacterium sp. TaxID=1871053 RepID=UPI002730328C|nr:amidase family protein [Phenylobacterium sp.]MDP1618669.1 amidase family protein [Phenylobacterium sp.]MDP1986574.1 amidase family protein [Phenylobacterium sp.]
MVSVRRGDAFALGRLDAHDQAALVAGGEATAAELAEAAIIRIEALDPQLLSVSWPAFDQARQRAAAPLPEGPLSGVPYLLKDSLDYPGLPSLAGSASRSAAAREVAYPYVRRLDAAGLVPVGKSAMPEFGLLPVTEPLIGPVTRNPWSPSHSPGGSSGGAGAAVAAGLVPLAHGSDGAGSIRIPSSACGLPGLKPGRGTTVRVRSRHVIEDLLVGDSLMARSVRDVAAGFALARPDSAAAVTGPSRRRLKIAYASRTLAGDEPHESLTRALEDTVNLCARLGHEVRPAWPAIEGPAALRAEQVLWSHIGADCVDAIIAAGQDPAVALEPWTRALGEIAAGLSHVDLEAAYAQIAALPRQLAAFFGDFDVLLTPTLSAPPPLIGEMAPDTAPDELMAKMFGWCGYTPLQNMAGTPAVTLPLAWDEAGLPLGLMFAADRGQEDLLLALAFELEAAAPWKHRWPPISVNGGAHGQAA